MISDGKRRHFVKSFPILVVEDNKDHQLLIAFALREKMPMAQSVMASTSQEALTHLQLTASDLKDFPRLVLLDLSIPSSEQGFHMLEKIRVTYPRLPVIVLSSHQDPTIIAKVYELGAHSFIQKPYGLDMWEKYFQSFSDYWINTVTLVPPNF